MTLARGPDLRDQMLGAGVPKVRDRAHECPDLRLRQRCQRKRDELAVASELTKKIAEREVFGNFLLARRHQALARPLEVGRGSTFSVHLPCVADSAKPVETIPSESLHQGSGKILLVEDETALRELAGRMLTEAGYIVASTGDGGEALRLSRTELESIDLLITDMVMPGMSGPDLAAHLLKRLPKLEVLYISGYADHPLIEAGALSNRETLLRKPFTHDQLLMTVQKIRGGGADRRLTA